MTRLPYIVRRDLDGYRAVIAEGTVIGRPDEKGFETREELERVMRELEKVLEKETVKT